MQDLSLLAALTLAYSTFSNKKNKMIWWQAINVIFYGLSNLFFRWLFSSCNKRFNIIKEYSSGKKKLDKKFTIIICILMTIVGVYFNNRAWLGLLPIIASVQYTMCVYVLKSAQRMRIALIINLLQWMIFDFLVKAYPMFALDIIIIIVTLINFLRFRNCDEEIDFKQKNKVEDIAETK